MSTTTTVIEGITSTLMKDLVRVGEDETSSLWLGRSGERNRRGIEKGMN